MSYIRILCHTYDTYVWHMYHTWQLTRLDSYVWHRYSLAHLDQHEANVTISYQSKWVSWYLCYTYRRVVLLCILQNGRSYCETTRRNFDIKIPPTTQFSDWTVSWEEFSYQNSFWLSHNKPDQLTKCLLWVLCAVNPRGLLKGGEQAPRTSFFHWCHVVSLLFQ